jgi:hypothetical protein
MEGVEVHPLLTVTLDSNSKGKKLTGDSNNNSSSNYNNRQLQVASVQLVVSEQLVGHRKDHQDQKNSSSSRPEWARPLLATHSTQML